jgi:predicted  nucleic acid-binding Zn-ribbon protein
MKLLRTIFDREYRREMQELKVRNAAVQAQMPTDMVSAHKHCSRNRAELLRSKSCGCFYCLKSFSPNEITEWTDDDRTAICPKCGIDSVLASASGFALTEGFLTEMHKHWF